MPNTVTRLSARECVQQITDDLVVGDHVRSANGPQRAHAQQVADQYLDQANWVGDQCNLIATLYDECPGALQREAVTLAAGLAPGSNSKRKKDIDDVYMEQPRLLYQKHMTTHERIERFEACLKEVRAVLPQSQGVRDIALNLMVLQCDQADIASAYLTFKILRQAGWTLTFGDERTHKALNAVASEALRSGNREEIRDMLLALEGGALNPPLHHEVYHFGKPIEAIVANYRANIRLCRDMLGMIAAR